MITRALLIFALFWVIARVFWKFVEGVVSGATTTTPGAQGGRTRGMQAGVKMLPCPVCGTYVVPSKALTASRDNQTAWFCSPECQHAWERR